MFFVKHSILYFGICLIIPSCATVYKQQSKQNKINAKKKRNYIPDSTGSLNLTFTTPFSSINFFNHKSATGRYQSAGPYGVSGGLDYFYKPHRYISASLGAATDKFVEHFGKGYIQTNDAIYLNLRDNFIKKKFSFGYGLHISKLIWNRVTIGDTVRDDQTVKNISAGFSFSANYRVTKKTRVGLLYQPGWINFNSKPFFYYQHFISFGFIYKATLRKRKKMS